MELSRTQRLLLACLSKDSQQINQIQQQGLNNADWQSLVTLSNQQWVTPQLFRLIEKGRIALEVPEEYYRSMQEVYFTSLKQNLRLFNSARQIFIAFVSQDIRVIPLKGVYLAAKVYGNIGLRPMDDIDLLVQRSDLFQARSALEELGYQRDPAGEGELEWYLSNHYHLPQLSKSEASKIEIHWNLAGAATPTQIDIDQVWEAARETTLDGVNTYEMAPEHLLLHICIHAAYNHRFSGKLSQFCDIAETIDVYKETLDWERLAQQARSWGVTRSIFLALRVTQRLLRVQLSENSMESLQPRGYNPDLETWVIQQLFHPLPYRRKLATIVVPRSWPQRSMAIILALFPPPAEMGPNYPELSHGLSWPLAYLKHLIIVVKRNWRTAWKLWCRDASEKAEIEQRRHHEILVDWQAGKIK